MKALTSHLSLDDVRAFFAEKLPEGASCPRCRVDQWSYADESEAGEIIGLSIVDRTSSPAGIYATIVMKCGNCGYLSTHAKSVVIDWLNEVGRE